MGPECLGISLLLTGKPGCRSDHWRALRGAWDPIFYSKSLEGYVEVMNASMRTLVQRLAPFAQSGQPVEIYSKIQDATLEVGSCLAAQLAKCSRTTEWCSSS